MKSLQILKLLTIKYLIEDIRKASEKMGHKELFGLYISLLCARDQIEKNEVINNTLFNKLILLAKQVTITNNQNFLEILNALKYQE